MNSRVEEIQKGTRAHSLIENLPYDTGRIVNSDLKGFATFSELTMEQMQEILRQEGLVGKEEKPVCESQMAAVE